MLKSILQVVIAVFLAGILPIAVITILVRLFKPSRILAIPTMIFLTAISQNIFKWLDISQSIKTISSTILLVIVFLAIALFGDQILGKREDDHETTDEEEQDVQP